MTSTGVRRLGPEAATFHDHRAAKRRALEGEAVPASEKIVSLFQPHTDIVARAGGAQSAATR